MTVTESDSRRADDDDDVTPDEESAVQVHKRGDGVDREVMLRVQMPEGIVVGAVADFRDGATVARQAQLVMDFEQALVLADEIRQAVGG